LPVARLEQEAHRIAARALSQQEQALTELLLPKDGLIFALDGPETYGALYEVRDDEEEVDRRLAYWLQSFREGNHATVERLTKAFELAGFALLAEIGLLALGLAVS
jgi:hypothetical protein